MLEACGEHLSPFYVCFENAAGGKIGRRRAGPEHPTLCWVQSRWAHAVPRKVLSSILAQRMKFPLLQKAGTYPMHQLSPMSDLEIA